MPSKLQFLFQASNILTRPSFQTSPFLIPFLHPINQTLGRRAASVLSSLSDNPGAYHKKIRRGRGPASGKGKTSGRGHKGQKQHGKVPRGFNGGQTKDEDVNPIRGFYNRVKPFTVDLTPLNLHNLQAWIAQGRIDPAHPITIKELGQSRCINPAALKDGVKLLATGAESITIPLHIVVSRASAAAILAVERAGGSVTTRYYTPFSIQRILKGKTDPIRSLQSQPVAQLLPVFSVAAANPPTQPGGEEKEWQNRLPDPVSRKAIEYYRDPEHRGYLSYQLKPGQGPSLFYKSRKVGVERMQEGATRAKGATAAESRLW